LPDSPAGLVANAGDMNDNARKALQTKRKDFLFIKDQCYSSANIASSKTKTALAIYQSRLL
jgi:hypothetical protein